MSYNFEHDSPVYLIYDGVYEVAYYARNYRKFKRVREVARQEWTDTTEQQVDSDVFWMIVACIQRRKKA